MNEWKRAYLKDIAIIEMGQSPLGESANTLGNGYPLLNGPTEFGSRYPRAVQFTTDPKRFSINGDILFCVRGSTGKMNWSDKEYAIGRGLAAIRHQHGESYKYFLKAIIDFNLDSMLASASGSTFPNISKEQLHNLEIDLPPLPEQQAIASVLSALDDKIDLLQRQNQTLEQMAATLFRQWFIEEAKEDWKEVKLGDYINCVNGVSYKSSELKESDVALVTLKNFARDGSLRIDGFKEFVGKFKDIQIVENGAIVVAHTDLTQDASLIGNPIRVNNILGYRVLVISMDLVKVEVKSGRLTDIFLFHLLKNSDFKDHALACSNGSSVIHLSKKALPSYIFKCPPINRINEFTERVKYIEEKANRNLSQIQTLQTTRDTLLPKLISGEVRLKGFENLV